MSCDRAGRPIAVATQAAAGLSDRRRVMFTTEMAGRVEGADIRCSHENSEPAQFHSDRGGCGGSRVCRRSCIRDTLDYAGSLLRAAHSATRASAVRCASFRSICRG